MGLILKTVATLGLATTTFVAGVLWTGGEDLDKTKGVIDSIVNTVSELKQSEESLKDEIAQLVEKDKDKDKKNKELEDEINKANKEAEDLRVYAEQKLQEVEVIKNR